MKRGKKKRQSAGNKSSRPAPGKRKKTGPRRSSVAHEQLNRALRLHQGGKLAAAKTIYEQILEASPTHSDALHLLGVIYHQIGQNDDAVSFISRALNIDPHNEVYQNNLGSAYLAQGRITEAAACFEKAIRKEPDYLDAQMNLGTAMAESGRPAAAMDHYGKVLTLDAANVRGHIAMATACHDMKRWGEAVSWYERAMKLAPGRADIFYNLGNTYRAWGRNEAAEDAYDKALALKPDFPEALNNLGIICQSRGAVSKAVQCYLKALEIKPADPSAHNNLGNAYKRMGRIEDALESYRSALLLQPVFSQAHSNYLLALHYQDKINPDGVFQAHQEWAGVHAPQYQPHWHFPNDRSPNRILRIGYISPDFYRHSVAYFFESILAQPHRDEFKAFCYADSDRFDEVTDRLQRLSDGWRQVAGMGDEKLAELVQTDRIDILVDLSGHTSGNRMRLFARKPAPIQVAHIGYPDTTGLATMDYRITDNLADPPGRSEKYHTEALVRLDDCFLCYRPPESCPAVAKTARQQQVGVTFGSFNLSVKISPAAVSVWSAILRRVPGSRLFLKSKNFSDHGVCQRYLGMFQEHGIAGDRIDLVGHVTGIAAHLDFYNRIDIALDTFPYNGTTTTCEALWMGTPVIALAGDVHVARVGASLLSAAGLPELVAESEEDYIHKAVALAGDAAKLSALHRGLRKKLSDSVLMNGVAYVGALTRAYRSMWRSWCRDEAAARVNAKREKATRVNAEGEEFFAAGNLASARSAFEKALGIAPDYATPHNNLGVLHWHLGDAQTARSYLQKALAIDPEDADALKNLDTITHEIKGRETLDTGVGKVARGGPEPTDISLSAALKAYQAGRPESAGAICRQLLETEPAHGEAMHLMGVMAYEQGQYATAGQWINKAIAVKPEEATFHNTLGLVAMHMGDPGAAVRHFGRAVELRPDFPTAQSNLLWAYNYRFGTDAAQVFEAHLDWGKRQAQSMLSSAGHFGIDPSPERPLRIGYVSPDFYEHPVAIYMLPILENHHHGEYEVYCYSNTRTPDTMTRRLKNLASRWRDISAMGDEEIIQRVRSDRIDILVDLAGHTGNNRLLVFAGKPAPVQVTYLGYPNTTGLAALDYRITDHWADPPGITDAYYTEQLIRLPHCFLCYHPPADAPDVSAPPCDSNGYLTFGSFNNWGKIEPEVVAQWSAILSRVPKSRLVLKSSTLADGETISRLLARFKHHGVEENRIQLMEKIRSHREHMGLYQQIDMGLDTFPYNGTTTTCEALWMGVPVVSLAGTSHAARVGVSLLNNAGLKDLVATSLADYVRIAVELAGSPERLAGLRSGLRHRMMQSPLMDAAGFVNDLEAAYRQMWRRWCGADTAPHI